MYVNAIIGFKFTSSLPQGFVSHRQVYVGTTSEAVDCLKLVADRDRK